MPCYQGIETKFLEPMSPFLITFHLSTDILSHGLQNSNYMYPGYTTSFEFRQCDEEEQLRNVSSIVD